MWLGKNGIYTSIIFTTVNKFTFSYKIFFFVLHFKSVWPHKIHKYGNYLSNHCAVVLYATALCWVRRWKLLLRRYSVKHLIVKMLWSSHLIHCFSLLLFLSEENTSEYIMWCAQFTHKLIQKWNLTDSRGKQYSHQRCWQFGRPVLNDTYALNAP